MKDHLLQSVALAAPEARRDVAREYLQLYLLRLLHQRGALARLDFLGGTALRLLHRLPRFAEALAFSAVDTAAWAAGRGPETLLRPLRRDLERAGYAVSVKAKQPRSAVAAFFRFDGLPAECGWTRDPRIALSLELEIDTNPPAGATSSTTLIQRFYPIAIRHHDLPSLFAGKLHALLTRPWTKGRDWCDLVWYLTEHPGLEPNLRFLAAALRQSGHDDCTDRWRPALRERLSGLDWSQVLDDVRPFVERQSDLEHLDPKLVDKLLATGP